MQVVTAALNEMFYWLTSALAIVCALLSKYWLGFGFLHAGLLFGMLYLAIVRIPLALNWSANLYGSVLRRVFGFQVFAILSFALCYFMDATFSNKFDSFWDALYFSATTWTTLGYGDISPVGPIRLLTSLEALTGMTAFAVFASTIWLYCDSRFSTKALDRQNAEPLPLTLDSAMGYFVETDSERVRVEQEIRARIQLRPCTCGNSRPTINKYYDVMGRLTPIARFHVVCRECGAFSKARLNAHLAAWSWNKGDARISTRETRNGNDSLRE